MRILLTLFISLAAFSVLSQKKKIDPSVYNEWKSLGSVILSDDGKYISYTISPLKGDGYLYLYNVETGRKDSVVRGENAAFSSDSKYLVFKINPGYDTLRNCELKKIDKKKWPKDSLGIYLLEEDTLIKKGKLKSYELSDENGWMVYELDMNDLPETPSKKKSKKSKKKKGKDDTYKSDGHLIYLYHSEKGSWCSKDVTSFVLSENGNFLAYTTHRKFKCDSLKLTVLATEGFKKWTLPSAHTSIDKLVFNDQESRLAYLYSDDTAKVKVYSLSVMNLSDYKELIHIDTTHSELLQGDAVSHHFQPRFTKNGNLLYFGAAEIPLPEVKDTLVESEKVKLDIWSYHDYRLQPQQNIERKKDLMKTDKYVVHLSTGKVVLLCGDSLKMELKDDIRGEFLVGRSDLRYSDSYNWDSPRKADYYRISVNTGEAELLREGSRFPVELSPEGDQFVYYDQDKLNYMYVDAKGVASCITCSEKNVVWTDDINGMPMQPYPLGIIGWDSKEENVYLQSEYDVWIYNIPSKTLNVLGANIGADNKIRIRPDKWSSDSVYVDFDNYYFTGFDEVTKGMHLYSYEPHEDHWDLRETAYYDAELFDLKRSENKKTYTMRRMTFIDYPEVYVYHGKPNETKSISSTNPQQSDYIWGTVELIKWKSYSGIELEGLLYKPEDFDSTKQYPLLVYYYELYSDRFHRYYSPKPTASIIYPTEYASAGYVVFIPDIRYTPGYPAKSAYDCIMSGTDAVLERYTNIDSTRMGLQGQSWGGYQTAQLITMTNRYSAAMAGAPVANMFSAYGGIRWGSGMNRQFQYERTQSRIGYTIWEKPELYIENSPLFHLPKVTTPLLIMHNDEDDAVPWYQGIELFTGLTRLNKEVWLLNYNGDKHNLMQDANRMDLSIRMRQFFDHYLLDQPAPRWMIEGLPAVEKGKELRYELIENPLGE